MATFVICVRSESVLHFSVCANSVIDKFPNEKTAKATTTTNNDDNNDNSWTQNLFMKIGYPQIELLWLKVRCRILHRHFSIVHFSCWRIWTVLFFSLCLSLSSCVFFLLFAWLFSVSSRFACCLFLRVVLYFLFICFQKHSLSLQCLYTDRCFMITLAHNLWISGDFSHVIWIKINYEQYCVLCVLVFFSLYLIHSRNERQEMTWETEKKNNR